MTARLTQHQVVGILNYLDRNSNIELPAIFGGAIDAAIHFIQQNLCNDTNTKPYIGDAYTAVADSI